MDFGAQVAPLRLLIKDHKPYDPTSKKPIPSRPVVNGKSGYNCHLSEILSLILGPVAKETNGNEINSTGDLLAEINELNLDLKGAKKSNSKFEQDSFCDYCSKCNLPPPSDMEISKAKNQIDRICSKKVNSAMHVSTNIKSKLNASRLATKLYHRCCIGNVDREYLI